MYGYVGASFFAGDVAPVIGDHVSRRVLLMPISVSRYMRRIFRQTTLAVDCLGSTYPFPGAFLPEHLRRADT
jgi:hypothetical protein